MRHALLILVVSLATTPAAAAPHVLRPGANHHLGDDSFVAAFGRAPTPADSEAVRMRVHLQYVHDVLAAQPATSPVLEGRRTELLGYLTDYIAKGTTPKNTYVPTRNPVFIDRDGTICAVGYLIERSAGRDLPERIAATHRLDYLEDIATAMPEVASWVAASGFTVDELASIQPGYPGPDVMHVTGWIVAKKEDDWQAPQGMLVPGDGPFHTDTGDAKIDGKFVHKQMVGVWTRKREGKLLGKGSFIAGAGTWTSFRMDGTRLAEGPFARSHANGEWRNLHPSGRLAATGTMHAGKRDGAWTFFYDTKAHGVLAKGTFKKGETMGGWKHFDARGKLVATASGRAWAGLELDIAPGKDGVRHAIHQGLPAESFRLDGFFLGKDKLYITEADEMFDQDGNSLTKTSDGWQAFACKWSAKRKAAARGGDVTELHELMLDRRAETGERDTSEGSCSTVAKKVPANRARHYDAMIASRSHLHAPIPAFDVDPMPAAKPIESSSEDEPADASKVAGTDNPDDMTTYLTNSMTWYIEWPHVDSTFVTLYDSLPGYQKGS